MHLDTTALTLREYRGGLALLGPGVDAAVEHFAPGRELAHPAHITLLSAAERRVLEKANLNTKSESLQISTEHIYVLGPASRKRVEWLVVLWNHADVFRATHGLGKKDYHITLSDTDDHTCDKGIDTLPLAPDALVRRVTDMGESALDHAFVASRNEETKHLLAMRLIFAYNDSYRGFARLASISPPKIACLAYARAAALNPALLPVAAAQIGKLRDAASYGPVMTATERESIQCPGLEFPWPEELHPLVGGLWTHPTAPRERQIFSGTELPRFFSWLYPGRVAAMSTPRSAGDITTLVSMGFTHVLSLTAESPLDPAWFSFSAEHVFVPVPNYAPPTIAEMDAIFARISSGGCWLMHCGGGVGRAGTVLACLVAMLGHEGEEQLEPRLDARSAIALVRAARPRSLETEAQERFVSAWVSHRWKRRAEVEEPYAPLRVEGKLRTPDDVQAVMMIGRPGSGKSWVAGALSKRRHTQVISQDESGSRAACETHASRAPRDALVVLDRCNPTAADRKHWLGLLDRPCVAVHFDYSAELCSQRINTRLDHPTLRAGRGARAQAQMDREMEPPTLAEGFAAILTIPSFSAARDAVRRLAHDPPLLKFPRTPHLFDLGAASADDVVALQETLSGNLTVEEKIDGANLGISLGWDGELRVQNRSHWVSSADRAQFRTLGAWLETQDESLRRLLARDDQFPERYILYGEWVVARHSIHYSSLPSPFVAFDLYDRVEDVFLSRTALERALCNTGICQVPFLSRCTSLSRAEILRFLEQTSMWSNSRVEGVYIRVEDGERATTLRRYKVVRGDFIAGDKHWARGPLVLNGILRYPDT